MITPGSVSMCGCVDVTALDRCARADLCGRLRLQSLKRSSLLSRRNECDFETRPFCPHSYHVFGDHKFS